MLRRSKRLQEKNNAIAKIDKDLYLDPNISFLLAEEEHNNKSIDGVVISGMARVTDVDKYKQLDGVTRVGVVIKDTDRGGWLITTDILLSKARYISGSEFVSQFQMSSKVWPV